MKTSQTYLRYAEWLSAENMHTTTKEWLSELNFIKDEHQFFEDLVTEFTSQLIDSDIFSNTREVVEAISKSKKRNDRLIETVKIHENELYIMVDGIDQKEKEKAYVAKHRDLIATIEEFLKEYRVLKTQLFEIIKNVIKEEKNNLLLDKK